MTTLQYLYTEYLKNIYPHTRLAKSLNFNQWSDQFGEVWIEELRDTLGMCNNASDIEMPSHTTACRNPVLIRIPNSARFAVWLDS